MAQVFYDMPDAEYRADPCERPSLTQSLAKILLDRSPRHAWCEHPRLNPNFRSDDDTKFDVGNVAHRLLIGRGKDVAAVAFDNWTTKAAKEAREENRARGILAVLQEQFDRAAAMAEAAREQLASAGYSDAFSDGHGEVVVTWNEGHLYFRTMIDWVVSTVRVFDYKSTALSCSPFDVTERPSVMGWDLQAAFHERALDAVDPANAGRRRHYFVAQETDPPYALSVVRISEADMTLGRKKLAMATYIWSDCMAANQWPLYPSETVVSQPRGYLETRLLEREISHEERMRRAYPPLVSVADSLMGG